MDVLCIVCVCVFFFNQKTAYEMRISAWSSDVCSSDLPINESSDDKSQIEEFIREYRGEGIQHIALSTNDIYATVEALRARGVKFMDTPETYYARVDARVPGHGESLARLQALNILIDGEIGRAHGRTPVANAHLVCRLLLETTNIYTVRDKQTHRTNSI